MGFPEIAMSFPIRVIAIAADPTFPNEAFTWLLEHHGVKVSMDGKGRYADNVFVERQWRSVQYEEVYLKRQSSGPAPAQDR